MPRDDYYTNTEADAGRFERAHDEDAPTWDEIAEWNWREMEDDRTAVMATMSDAHREWHNNTGIPMGTPGCPQDACHLPDDLEEPEPQPGEGIKCAHCKGRHWTVADVRYCSGIDR